MKKILSITLAITFVLCLGFTCFADKTDSGLGRIIDNTNSITAEHRAEIENYIEEAWWQYNYSLVIVFDSYLSDFESERTEFTEQYYSNGNFSEEGIMLYVGVDSRTYDIYSSHKNSYSEITESELDEIDFYVYTKLTQDDFSEAARDFAEYSLTSIKTGGAEKYYFGGKTQSELLSGIAISVFLGAIVALIIVLIMKAGMKGIKPQRSAATYINRNTIKLKTRRDSFLYSTVTKVRRDTSSSSGGGSSRSSGGSHRGGRF